ncbi:thiol-disulfide oxidoreductase DCC family protein [Flavobacterium sp. CLA17]|uniref:thiol-disulfide oxidoreductase DCC family protein n=1 Tax=Flavobacterium sp. CLA17 TaxID=2724135 RepID=UPI00351B3EFF
MCNSFVLFLLKQDKSARMHFISLQSEKAKTMLKEYNVIVNSNNMTSIYYLKNKTVKSHSSAIISIFYDLGFPWKIVILFKIIPKKIRDTAYHFIAINRYRFFGKQESCALLSTEDRKRILD